MNLNRKIWSFLLVTFLVACASDDISRDEFDGAAGLPTNITGASLAMECAFVKNADEQIHGNVGCVLFDGATSDKISTNPTETTARIKDANGVWVDTNITHLGPESQYTFILDDKGQIEEIFDASFVEYDGVYESEKIKLVARIDRGSLQGSTHDRDFYINALADIKNTFCTKTHPCNSINKAITQTPKEIRHVFNIYIANEGVYDETVAFTSIDLKNEGTLNIIGFDKKFEKEESFTIEPTNIEDAKAVVTIEATSGRNVILRNINITSSISALNIEESNVSLSNIAIKSNTNDIALLATDSDIQASKIAIETQTSGVSLVDKTRLKIYDSFTIKNTSSDRSNIKAGFFSTNSEVLINQQANLMVENFKTNIMLQNSILTDNNGEYSGKKIISRNSQAVGLGLNASTMNIRYTSIHLENCNAICLSALNNSSLNIEPRYEAELGEAPIDFKIKNKEIPVESSQDEKELQMLTFLKNSTAVIDLRNVKSERINLCNINGVDGSALRFGLSATAVVRLPQANPSSPVVASGVFCTDEIYNNKLDLSSRFFLNNRSCDQGEVSIKTCLEN